MISTEKLNELVEAVRVNKSNNAHWLIGAMSCYMTDEDADRIIRTAKDFSDAR